MGFWLDEEGDWWFGVYGEEGDWFGVYGEEGDWWFRVFGVEQGSVIA